jgi:hypothetical protein
MPGLSVQVIFQDVRNVEADALVVGFFKDVRPLKGLAGRLDWLLCGSLSRLLLENRLRGSLGDVALLTAQGKVPAPKIFLVGFGARSEFSLAALRTAAGTAAASAAGAGVGRAAMEFLQPPGVADDDCLPVIREGLAEGAGGRSLAVSLLAPDAAAYERLSRLVKA